MILTVKFVYSVLILIYGIIQYIYCDESFSRAIATDSRREVMKVVSSNTQIKQFCPPGQNGTDGIENPCQLFLIRNEHTNKTKVGCCESGFWFNETSGKCRKIETFSDKRQQECFKKEDDNIGTTPNIRDVIIGRCWNYQLFLQPHLFPEGNYKNCTYLYELFHKAFVNKKPCGEVKFGAYNDFLKYAHVENPPYFSYTDKLLFWSGSKQFSQEYSNSGKRLYTLENTLPGFLIDNLVWCGQKQTENNKRIKDLDSGINFESCPPWGSCENQAQVVFWEEASEDFARIAREQIHLMLNGSDAKKTPFRNDSFFASHELKTLNSKNVTKVKILVSHTPGQKIIETCNNGPTLKDLRKRLREKGISSTCEDNPADVLHLLCTDEKDSNLCQKRIIPKKQHSLFTAIRFGYKVESERDK